MGAIQVTKTQELIYLIVDARASQSSFAPNSIAHSKKALAAALIAMGVKAEKIAEHLAQLDKTWDISI